jgi:hypothetical protein
LTLGGFVAIQPTHLCIISRHPLPGWHLVTALQASLGPEDYLDIIMDRRHGGSYGQSGLKEDRRRQSQADLALEANGFAIVPASAPLLDDEHEARLESIQNFQPQPRQSSSTLTLKLLGVLSGVTLGALVWLLVGHVTGQSLLSQLFTSPRSGGPERPPSQTIESSVVARSSAVTEAPVIAETRPAPPEAAPARPNSESAASGPSKVAGPETGQGASGARPKLSATARQSANAPPLSNKVAGAQRGAAAPKPTPEQAVGHRAELVGEPVSRGWGDSYAVRLLDPAGRPMVVTAALLVARMADGTVEKIPMGALPEPGTYRATVPTGRSTPVDLRVRMTTGQKSLEVSVRPRTPA